MASISKRSVPISMAAEQAGRVLTPERQRELTIDTIASWALDGLAAKAEGFKAESVRDRQTAALVHRRHEETVVDIGTVLGLPHQRAQRRVSR